MFFLTKKFPLFQANNDVEALMEIAVVIGRRKVEKVATLHSASFHYCRLHFVNAILGIQAERLLQTCPLSPKRASHGRNSSRDKTQQYTSQRNLIHSSFHIISLHMSHACPAQNQMHAVNLRSPRRRRRPIRPSNSPTPLRLLPAHPLHLLTMPHQIPPLKPVDPISRTRSIYLSGSYTRSPSSVLHRGRFSHILFCARANPHLRLRVGWL